MHKLYSELRAANRDPLADATMRYMLQAEIALRKKEQGMGLCECISTPAHHHSQATPFIHLQAVAMCNKEQSLHTNV